jgi:hypothetical protein
MVRRSRTWKEVTFQFSFLTGTGIYGKRRKRVTVLEMCERYYPRLWGRERLEALVRAGRLSREELEGILGRRAENGR